MGLRNWVSPDPRHERLRAFADEALGGARGLRILDVGCGAGVMSDHLTRFGEVTGVDLSAPAIELARRLVPRAAFVAGPLEEVDVGGDFDVVVLFDVLEHVPTGGREAFLGRLGSLLAPEGRILASTPHPRFTRWLHEHRPDLLQPVDEPVEPADVSAAVRPLGLELVQYRLYGVDRPGQYQLLVLAPPAEFGAAASPAPRPGRLKGAGATLRRRLRVAAALRRAHGVRGAAWALRPRGDPPEG
jgi:SAM-dependent methyltransferase